MTFWVALSILGVIAAALLLGFITGGLHERQRDDEASSALDSESTAPRPLLGVTVGLVVVLIGSSLQLVDPSVFSPLWLQYLLLAVFPGLIGYGARRLLAARLSAQE
ncbi:hypothetical protein JF66_16455 [Cryobacterium sp. MLB-32]|uniref:hypothetical protein n=1 Tax=Cryobacterium sp. MLB-32 TaxID=1529318 RepID=UPI0004E6029B|nr:hypothetical protein [Cryobacterium sp. MLB-32]KFF58727.1 hypothetical protein JF66_16455 [Cryobacterium sp. MLB-32]